VSAANLFSSTSTHSAPARQSLWRGKKFFRQDGQDIQDKDLAETELKSGSQRRKISKARQLFCQLSVVKIGYPGAQVARLLGVSTSDVVRAAHSAELPEVENYL